jgi:hypothetical protein
MPTDRPRKRVLVTGATRRLGALANTLLNRGYAVRAVTRVRVRPQPSGCEQRVRRWSTATSTIPTAWPERPPTRTRCSPREPRTGRDPKESCATDG